MLAALTWIYTIMWLVSLRTTPVLSDIQCQESNHTYNYYFNDCSFYVFHSRPLSVRECKVDFISQNVTLHNFISKTTEVLVIHCTQPRKQSTLTTMPVGNVNLQISRIQFVNCYFGHLSKLEETLTQFTLLEKLVFVSNFISTINENTFVGMSRFLYSLILNDNNLTDIPTAVKHIMQIRDLQFENNNIQSIKPGFFAGMETLKCLNLAGNQISTISSDTFLGLTYFTRLDLSRNHLQSITNDSLSGLKSLYFIVLDHNYIVELEIQLTSIVPQFIITLNMSNNRIEKISLDSYNGIGQTVKIVDLSFNKLKILPIFPSCRQYSKSGSSISQLYLQANLLTDIMRMSLVCFGRLEIINLADNQIKTIQPYLFPELHTLTDLNLANNNISSLGMDTFYTVFDAYHRSILYVYAFLLDLSDNPLMCDCATTWLAYHKKVAKFPLIKSFEKLYCFYKDPGKEQLLWELVTDVPIALFLCESNKSCNVTKCACCADIGHCDCANYCPHHCECYDNDIGYLSVECIHENTLNTIPTLPIGITTLIVLDNSNITELDKSMFLNARNLTTIVLNNNGICEIANNTFMQHVNLLELSLNRNQLTFLNGDMFRGLNKLAILILSRNNIAHIEKDTFQKMSHLESLHLEHNQLQVILQLKFGNKDILTNISLAYNKWSCDCDTGPSFKSWLALHATVINDLHDINCYTGTETDTPKLVMDMDFDRCHRNDKQLIIGIAISGGLLVCVAFVTIVMVWKRREIQILLFYCYCCKLHGNTDEEEYDAFLSYSSDDAVYVRELVDHLEGRRPHYKLLFHHRDWLSGPTVFNNIENSVSSSKKTILFLSRNFLASHWCTYEFIQSHQKVLMTRKPHLIIVLLEQEMPEIENEDLRIYATTHTYLKWNEQWFWRKLKMSLGEPLNQAPKDNEEQNGDAFELI